MTRLTTRSETSRTTVPSRLERVFDVPILSWQRLETDPLDAAYYVLLDNSQEQILWINQRATDEPKVVRNVRAMQLLPDFMPPLIRADTTRTRLEYPYLITGYLPIPALRDAWQHLDAAGQKRAAAAWGRALHLIHHIRFSLAGDLAYPEAEGSRLAADLEARWQLPLRLAVKDYMLDTPKLVAALKRGLRLVEDAPIALCHGHPDARSFLFDTAAAEMRAAVNFSKAHRSDPLSDLAAITHELEVLGCTDAFMQGYGALSKWERKRLTFYQLHHALLRYALALSHLPNQLALSRMQLADRLAAEPGF